MSYSIKPDRSTRKEAEKTIENALSVAESVIDDSPDITASLAWVPERREHGEAWSSEYIHLLFNDEDDNWTGKLEANTWRAFFEAYFYQRSDTDLHWQVLLKNAFAIHQASKYTEIEPWKEDLVQVDDWETVRKNVEEGEVPEENWIEAASAFYRLVKSMEEEKSPDEMTDLKRSGILDRGDRLFEE